MSFSIRTAALPCVLLLACTSVRGSPPAPAGAESGAPEATERPAAEVERPTSPVPSTTPDSPPDTVIPTATVLRPRDSTAAATPEDWRIPARPTDPLAVRLDAHLDAPPYDGMFWGLLVQDAETGTVLYRRNDARRFVPASALKVVTAAAALNQLGSDYRYRTDVYRQGSVRAGVLDGSLYVAGSGDPTWSVRFRNSWRQPLDALADQLLAAGIRRVTGRVVVDASRWDSTSVVGTWQVEDIPWGWAAGGGALVVADGDLRLRVVGSRTRDRPAAVSISPELPERRFRADVLTTATDSVRLSPSWHPESGQIVLRGEVPRVRRYVTRLAMRDPVRIAGELLLEVLEERGITVEGGLGFAWDLDADLGGGCGAGRLAGCPQAERVATVDSPELRTIARAMLEPSHNWLAEQMVRTLGLETEGIASWPAGLRAATRTLVDDFGVDPQDLDLHDGSGLSSYSLITPRALVRILEAMRVSPGYLAFRDALAAPGEEDSTLSERLSGLEGRVFAKTGTLHHVNSLVGYVLRDDGRELIFAILSNSAGMGSDEVRPVVDGLVRELARGG